MTGRRSGIKLLAFLLVCAVVTAGLFLVLGNTTFESTNSYSAAFSNVSQMKNGSPVRIAGVDVGKVTGIRIADHNAVRVDFTVDSSVQLETTTRATVRYKNLIGDRYLELSNGSGGLPLRAGGSIPATRTSPALNLDTLLNGFTPLFTGLDPTQINGLSTEIIQVLQGESGTVTSLLTSVASLTTTLANRDTLIGNVIDNLNTVLSTVDANRDGLGDLIDQLQQLVSGLAADRDPIGAALPRISTLAATAGDLLREVRPDLRTDVSTLGAVAKTLNANTDTLNLVLDRLPAAYSRLARGGAYGNFFNFYLCGIKLKLTGADGNPIYTPMTTSDAARCK